MGETERLRRQGQKVQAARKQTAFMKEHPNRLLTDTSIQLLLQAPFYAHLLSGLIKQTDERIPTLAVGLHQNEQLALHVNPVFWKPLPAQLRQGVLEHELLHIALGHLFAAESYPHRQIFNIAADLVVNQYIDRAKLPAGALQLEQFTNLSLETDRAVGYYYYSLLDLHRKGGDGADEELLRSWLLGGAKEALDRHQLWHSVQRLSRAEQENLQQNVEAIVRAISHKVGNYGMGLLPSALQAYLKQLTATPPTVDWRRALRLFAASSEITTVRSTIRRPSRRYGTIPGSKVQPRQKILIAIDTSGSIGTAELNCFFSEVHHLWRQRVAIKIAECDAALQRVYNYRGQPPERVQGRGGTAFDPPIQYANQNYRPDALVYFTDGYGRPPSQLSRCPILWLISPSGIRPGHDTWYELPGQVVKMNKDYA